MLVHDLAKCAVLPRLPFICALAMIAACGMDEPRAGETLPGLPARTILAVNWDTLWVVGGSEADSLLLNPLRVVAGRGRVYVLDPGGSRVTAFRAADGSVLWTAGQKGPGPGEFLAPRAMALLPDGRIVVADMANARLSILAEDGTFRRTVALRGVAYVLGLCALDDGSLLVFPGNSRHHLIRISIDGAVLGPLQLPWPDLADASVLARQIRLANPPTGETCIAALNMGRGFARFDHGRFQATAEYIERVELPTVETRVSEDDEGRVVSRADRVRSGTLATRGIAVAGDTLAVAFSGTTPRRGKLIDLYTVATGRYIGSLVYDRSVQAIGYDSGTYFVLHATAGYPTLAAVVPRPR